MTHKWRTMAGVSLGAFSAPFGVSAVSIGLPAIARAFHQDVTATEWVIVAYVLVVTSLLTTFGRLGDLVNIKNLYVAGFAIYTAGALVSGLSQSFPLLIGGRAVQGVGGAMMFSVSAAIVTRAFPASERGLGLGVNALFTYAGLAVGPLVGAFLLTTFSWEAIFLFNVPLGVIGVALAVLFIGDVPGLERRTRFDVPGALLGSVALLCLLLVLSRGPAWGWGSPPVLGLAAGSLTVGVLFVLLEGRTAAPLVDLSLFQNRLFSAALVSGLLAYLSFFMLNLLAPFYLIRGLGLDYLQAGLLYTPVAVGMLLFGPASGWLSDRIGTRALTSSGMVLLAISFFWLGQVGMHPSYVWLALVLLLNGVGVGLFSAPNNSAIMGAVPAARVGTAAGVLATARNLGMALGIATAAAVTAIRQPVHLASHLGSLGAAVASYQDGFIVAGAIAVLAAAASLVRGSFASPAVQRGLTLTTSPPSPRP